MENKKKMAFNVVFLILVFAGTIYGVFHGEDLGEIARILKTVNLLWLIPGFICVIVFIWGESIIIYYMMRTLGIKRKKWRKKQRKKRIQQAKSVHFHNLTSQTPPHFY